MNKREYLIGCPECKKENRLTPLEADVNAPTIGFCHIHGKISIVHDILKLKK